MGRPHRIQAPGVIYNVGTRGNRRQSIYLDPFDRDAFLIRFGRAAFDCRWSVLAYCLMTNHYHAAFETTEPNIAVGMHVVNGSYAQRFNLRHGTTGHLFERRYYGEPVESEAHALEVVRYHLLNPVRAGLCAHPLQWPWSSLAATLGLDEPQMELATEQVLSFFGDDVARSRRRFREFVEAGIPAAAGHVPVPGTGTCPGQPKPYVPGNRSARSLTRSAPERPTTFR